MVAVDSARNGLVREIPLEQIEPSDFNPRQSFDPAGLAELAASIKQFGLIEPIVVRLHAVYHDDGRGHDVVYQIIAGERRYRAAVLAKLETIPCMVRAVDDTTALRMAIVENLERRDLDPIEEARGYQLLAERAGMRQKAIAAAVNRSQPAVANALRLLELPEDVQERIRAGELSRAHGVALASLKDFSAVASRAAELAVSGKWTSKQCEQAIHEGGYQLSASGVARRIAAAHFDTAVCKACPFGAYRKGSGSYGTELCLKPEHFDELQEAAEAERAARLAEVSTAGVPTMQELNQESRHWNFIHGEPPAGCNEDCPCRRMVADAMGEVRPACIDHARQWELRRAEERAANEAREAALAADVARLQQIVAGMSIVGPAEWQIITAALAARMTYNDADRKTLRDLAAKHGVELPADREAGRDPASWVNVEHVVLARILIEAVVTDDLTDNRYSPYRSYQHNAGGKLADHYLGPVMDGEASG